MVTIASARPTDASSTIQQPAEPKPEGSVDDIATIVKATDQFLESTGDSAELLKTKIISSIATALHQIGTGIKDIEPTVAAEVKKLEAAVQRALLADAVLLTELQRKIVGKGQGFLESVGHSINPQNTPGKSPNLVSIAAGLVGATITAVLLTNQVVGSRKTENKIKADSNERPSALETYSQWTQEYASAVNAGTSGGGRKLDMQGLFGEAIRGDPLIDFNARLIGLGGNISKPGSDELSSTDIVFHAATAAFKTLSSESSIENLDEVQKRLYIVDQVSEAFVKRALFADGLLSKVMAEPVASLKEAGFFSLLADTVNKTLKTSDGAASGEI